MTLKDTARFIDLAFTEHNAYWNDKLAEMKKYRVTYESRFWEDSDVFSDEGMIRVETADCFSYIEGFVASLFSRAPAVVIGKDLAASTGNEKIAQAVANRFLFTQREQLEIATRLALIYPHSFIKLSPQYSDNMLDRVAVRAVPAWEVIVDRDASSFDSQRFMGHAYWLPVANAKEKFGPKKFDAIPKEDYFQNAPVPFSNDNGTMVNYGDLPEEYLYIHVVEFYDFIKKKLCFWSPNWKNGEEPIEVSDIPLTTYDDRPLPQLVPLYFSRSPTKPMDGLSAVARVYDQFYEKNILRTYWANAVRKDSRQYIYKEGVFDEESLAKITAGIDGAMIGVDEQSLEGIIREVPNTPISSNFDRYLAYIESDINRGSILAPFSRGEASKATATEITALAQYSASEIGKMARDRDGAIEQLTMVYLRLIYALSEKGEKVVMDVDGTAKVVIPADLEGKFRIVALDQGNQPLSDAIKKQNLITLLPILTELGVPAPKLLDEVVRAYELPKDFVDAAKEALQAAQEAQAAQANITSADANAGLQAEAGPAEQVSDAQGLATMLAQAAGTGRGLA